MKTQILLIDDDSIATLVNKRIIHQEYPEAPVYDFRLASHALNYLKENRKSEKLQYIIFLDLNMPEINGWEFMEILEKDFSWLNFRIYLLTSSIDQNDKRKAGEFKDVHSYIEKPLNRSKLPEIDLQPRKYSDKNRERQLI